MLSAWFTYRGGIYAVFGAFIMGAAMPRGHFARDNQRQLKPLVMTLMNARGLMELIVLNISLERGIVMALVFTVMVIIAIVTTLMATPIFEWVFRRDTTVTINYGLTAVSGPPGSGD